MPLPMPRIRPGSRVEPSRRRAWRPILRPAPAHLAVAPLGPDNDMEEDQDDDSGSKEDKEAASSSIRKRRKGLGCRECDGRV